MIKLVRKTLKRFSPNVTLIRFREIHIYKFKLAYDGFTGCPYNDFSNMDICDSCGWVDLCIGEVVDIG